MPQVVAPALVLRKFDFGESSQVLHLITRTHGRVHVLVKGSYKPKSAFQGPLDVLELGDARFYPRREGLSVLGGFDRRSHFPAIRRDLERLDAAFTVMERLLHSSRENHADPHLFDLGLSTLAALGDCAHSRIPLELLRFDLRLLHVLGLGPGFEECAHCGADLGDETSPLLSAARGGALCAGCRDSDHLALPATRGVLNALRLLAEADAAQAARLTLSRADLGNGRRLADALLRHALEREIRSGSGR